MFVLDTNVVSALRRPGASATPVVEWVARQQAALLYISAVTILEIAQERYFWSDAIIIKGPP